MDITRSFAPEPNVRWTFELEEEPKSGSLLLDGATVYVATNDRLAGHSVVTGDRRWETAFDTGGITPVAVRDGTVYASDGDVVHALNSTESTGTFGNERWRARGGDRIATTEEMVYLGAGTLDARSSWNGKLRWRFAGDEPIHRKPVVHDETVYVSDNSGGLYAVSTEDGSERWNAFHNSENPNRSSSQSIAVAGVIPEYDTTHSTGSVLVWDSTYGSVSACAADTGRLRWRFMANDGRKASNATITMAGGRIYVAAGRRLHVLSPATGDERWHVTLPDEISGSIHSDGFSVFVGTTGGEVYSFARKNGTQRWSFGTEEDGTTRSRTDDYGRPIAWQGKELDALDASGELRWKRRFESPPCCPPSVANDFVYVLTGDGTIHALGTAESAPIFGAIQVAKSLDWIPVFGAVVGSTALAGAVWKLHSSGDETEGEMRESADEPEYPTWNGYELHERLDAETHLARTMDGDTVLLRRFTDPPETFERDAKEWKKLGVDGVQQVLGWGIGPEPWVAVERVNGRTASEIAATLDEGNAVDVVGRAAEIVHLAHKRGVFHESLSPENVVVTDSGVVVTDWRFTGTGDGRERSVPADVRRLGGLVRSLLSDEPSEPLRDVLERAAASDPDERYESALAFADMLRWAARNR
ncbi:cell surface protein/ lipoprotein [Haladaptatus paucihalophilus DX253]|nr:PQQ-binding-like beta-propeller repeat protein [Haladaptatus paucihalophilus]EFW93624.1 cell surface protein/ lipoprotein [Haladaptatus paucihalophilus DX253]